MLHAFLAGDLLVLRLNMLPRHPMTRDGPVTRTGRISLRGARFYIRHALQQPRDVPVSCFNLDFNKLNFEITHDRFQNHEGSADFPQDAVANQAGFSTLRQRHSHACQADPSA